MEAAREADRAVLAALRADLDAERAAREARPGRARELRAALEAAQAGSTEAGCCGRGRPSSTAAPPAWPTRSSSSAAPASRPRPPRPPPTPRTRSPSRVVADLDAAASALRERATPANGTGRERLRRGRGGPGRAGRRPTLGRRGRCRPSGSGRRGSGRRRRRAGRGRSAGRRRAAPRPTPRSLPPRLLPSGRGGRSCRRPAAPARAHATGRSQRQYPWLRGALVKLAHDDPQAAGRIIAGLLPVQSAIVQGPVDYDLTIAEVGTFAVTVAGGRAYVKLIERAARAPRGRVPPRRRRAHARRADRRRARTGSAASAAPRGYRAASAASSRCAPSPPRGISLAEAARAGARLEPGARLPHLPLRGPGRLVARPLVHRRPADRRRPAGDLVHQRSATAGAWWSSRPPRPRAAPTRR